MRNLLAFISRYQFTFMFLIFMIISFSLIYNNNYFQRSRIVSTTGNLTGKLNTVYSNFSNYFDLKRANEQLAAENAKLRAMLRLRTKSIPDSLLILASGSTLRFISARVIANSVQFRNNYFMIDKGYRHGIQKDMGVITNNGVVGIIVDVSENYASGISVLHKDSKISGRIKKNDQLVNVSWDGWDYRMGDLQHIPSHVNLVPGDTIVTSGNSQIFPEGIMIGTVDHIDDELENLFKKGKIVFSEDYNKLTYVYVVENTRKEEIKRLKMSMPNNE
jgi:rod shape-determining protein MreC